jgi:hypothetical protein
LLNGSLNRWTHWSHPRIVSWKLQDSC